VTNIQEPRTNVFHVCWDGGWETTERTICTTNAQIEILFVVAKKDSGETQPETYLRFPVFPRNYFLHLRCSESTSHARSLRKNLPAVRPHCFQVSSMTRLLMKGYDCRCLATLTASRCGLCGTITSPTLLASPTVIKLFFLYGCRATSSTLVSSSRKKGYSLRPVLGYRQRRKGTLMIKRESPSVVSGFGSSHGNRGSRPLAILASFVQIQTSSGA
jgi:hypothetical protein